MGDQFDEQAFLCQIVRGAQPTIPHMSTPHTGHTSQLDIEFCRRIASRSDSTTFLISRVFAVVVS